MRQSLESILIKEANIATEGTLFDKCVYENLNMLNDKKTMIVITTDSSRKYGGMNTNIVFKNYHSIIYFNYDKYLETGRIETKYDGKIDDTLLNNLPKYTDNKYSQEKFTQMVNVCDEYITQSNTLVILVTSFSTVYGYQECRNHPVVIVWASKIASIINAIKNKLRENNFYDTNFNRFNLTIPKELFVKNTKLNLFHISLSDNIKKLEPRISDKRMWNENIRIPRISAASTLKACVSAIGYGYHYKDKPLVFYAYRIIYDNSTNIVKPNARLVPDVDYTNEYWILDPVKVEKIGTIDIERLKDNKYNITYNVEDKYKPL